MNIPFGQIYNHLAGSVDDDIIIYRYDPPGSKKLGDLRQLRNQPRTYIQAHDSVNMIFHDQEPLCPAQITSVDIQQWYANNAPTLSWHLQNDELLRHLCERDLAATCDAVTIADRNILVHSELNSAAVTHYQSLGFATVYWWSHAVIARDWYRYAEHDWRLSRREPIQDFLVYNRAWSGTREYRLTFASMLMDAGLVPQCQITFQPNDGTHFRDHQFSNTEFLCRRDLDQLPVNQAHSDSSADYAPEDYAQCWWEVVQETVFDDTRIHLTEKTLRPLACGSPFLILAAPGALKYLRSQGFLTFNGVIDESYDDVINPRARMEAVIKEMLRIRSWSQSYRQQVQRWMAPLIEHNRRWFFSQVFLQQRLSEWHRNYSEARHDCQDHRQGRQWIACRRMLATDPDHRALITRENPRVDVQEIKEVLQRCRTRRGR